MRQGMTVRHAGLIACCCATAGIPAAMLVSTPGIFYPAIAEELGVQTAEVSAWMSVALISSAVLLPLVGNVIGRIGMRPLMLTGLVAAAGAMGMFSLATAPWMLWLAGIAAGYSFVVCLSLCPAALINRWFSTHVGLLLGVYSAFTGIGGVCFLMLGQWLIDLAGWRAAYGVFALVTLVVCVPLVLLFVRDWPSDCGLRPLGAEAGESGAAEPGAGEVASAEVGNPAASDLKPIRKRVRTAYRMPVFWGIIVFGFLVNLVCQTNSFFPKYVNWVNEQAALGLASTALLTGAALSSFAQAGNALGKIGLGAYSDFSVRSAVVLLTGCGMVGMALMWQLPATPALAVGGLVFGFFLAGVLVLVPMVARQVFGSGPAYPLLYSRVAVAPTLGGAAGNIVWPWLADNLGGFDVVFGTALACMGAILLLGLSICRHPHPA